MLRKKQMKQECRKQVCEVLINTFHGKSVMDYKIGSFKSGKGKKLVWISKWF
jgi:hypothetical protein